MKINIADKRALSSLITMLLTIALVLILMGILFAMTQGLIQDRIQKTEKCMDILDKININQENTCYKSVAAAGSRELQFSIEVKELTIDDVLVTINDGANSKSFKLKDDATKYFVAQYLITVIQYGIDLEIPDKNEGITYVADLTNPNLNLGKPISVKIAPVVGDEQCDTIDTLIEIPIC